MNVRTFLVSAVAMAACAALPARAVDPQLMNLVMPDAKVLAGVNVDQAKTTPFGQYILQQIQSQGQAHLQQLTAQTGFDPTRDVSEVLVATNSTPPPAAAKIKPAAQTTAVPHQPTPGLFLARGMFDPAKIAAAATAAGGSTESYGGLTILEDPKKQGGVAFLNSSYVVAGDIASVKAAIDRRTAASSLPAALIMKAGQLSASQDAWFVSTVPLSTLHPPANAPAIPGLGANGGNAFQNIQQASGGVKFGSNVVAMVQAEAATAQDATNMAGVLQLLVSVMQTQTAQNPQAAALANAIAISTQGATLNVTFTVPEQTMQDLLKNGHHAGGNAQRRPVRQM